MEHTKTEPLVAALAAEVRAAQGRLSMDTAALADLTGIPKSTLHRRVKGRYPFDVAELAKVARALDTDVASLVAQAEAVTR